MPDVASDAPHMIEVDRISKSFTGRKPAVNDVSFTVAEGETLILLGTSGCGKTTTLRMINRLIEPSSGHIRIGGVDVQTQSPETLRKGIGYVLQDSGLFPHYTVAENVAVVPALLHWSKDKIRDRTAALLEKLHLPPADYLNAYPGQLSGGQQQRVGLARALAADQPVLLMDEPFGALDPLTRAHVRKDFRTLDEVRHRTVIMVTHDVAEAFELGDRICLMHEGKIAQWGTPAELLLHPRSDFVRTFFEEGRLQLELGVMTLGDVDPWLPEPTGGSSSDALSGNISLWSALQQTAMRSDGAVLVNGTRGTSRMSSGDLLQAYTHYKNKEHG